MIRYIARQPGKRHWLNVTPAYVEAFKAAGFIVREVRL
jgi:hypothetical protein